MIKAGLPRKFTYKIPHFTVMQWNQLNASLTTPESFPKIHPDYLKWEYRKDLLTKEIISSNADIICLEEVDQVSFYEELFKSLGYSLIKGQKFGGTGDWLLLAYRENRFQLQDSKVFHYNDQGQKHSQLFIQAILKIDAERTLIVFVTHLKAKGFEDVRIVQTSQLLESFKQNEFVKTEEKQKVGVVICGDFNAEPHFQCMKALLSELDSVYQDAEYTTFKIRDKEYCRVIDYILYNKNVLQLMGRQEIPKKEEIGLDGLPNSNYPSDHLSLCASFQFNN